MARAEGSEDRSRSRWQDSLWVLGATVLVVGVGVRLILGGASAWPQAVVGAAPVAVGVVWWLRRRRVRDARAFGTEPDDVPAMERQIVRGGPAPRDPERRRAMSSLVDSRQQRLRRNRWWALPLMALVCFGTPVMWLAAGSVTAGLWALAPAAVAMGWVVWVNLRFDRRLSQMRGRLQG